MVVTSTEEVHKAQGGCRLLEVPYGVWVIGWVCAAAAQVRMLVANCLRHISRHWDA